MGTCDCSALLKAVPLAGDFERCCGVTGAAQEGLDGNCASPRALQRGLRAGGFSALPNAGARSPRNAPAFRRQAEFSHSTDLVCRKIAQEPVFSSVTRRGGASASPYYCVQRETHFCVLLPCLRRGEEAPHRKGRANVKNRREINRVTDKHLITLGLNGCKGELV